MTRTSTIKGKQSVHYRHISDEGLETLINLPKAAATLLFQVIKDADKKDNCCQLSPKQLIDKYELNHSNAYTQIRKLKSVDFLREVKDVSGTARLMVNPSWMAWQSRDLVRFTILMYSLGSHDLAVKHLDLEDQCRGRIDVDTGEHSDWFRSGLEHADQHYDLQLNTSYEYIPIGKPPYVNTPQKVLPLPHTNSIRTSNVEYPVLQSSEHSACHEADDDYDSSWSYRRAKPAILSMKDIISYIV